MSDFDTFESAFRANHSGAHGFCHCGKEFYDSYNSYDAEWHDVELPKISERPNSAPLDHSVGYVYIDGNEFVDGCDCWHKRARQIISFVNIHDREIANYINQRKRSLQEEVNLMPEIETGEAAQKTFQ